MSVTKEQIVAALEILKLLADTIRVLKQVSSGHLYVHVMNHLSLEQYQSAIRQLKNTKLIREESHLLIWNVE